MRVRHGLKELAGAGSWSQFLYSDSKLRPKSCQNGHVPRALTPRVEPSTQEPVLCHCLMNTRSRLGQHAQWVWATHCLCALCTVHAAVAGVHSLHCAVGHFRVSNHCRCQCVPAHRIHPHTAPSACPFPNPCSLTSADPGSPGALRSGCMPCGDPSGHGGSGSGSGSWRFWASSRCQSDCSDRAGQGRGCR